MRKAKIKDVCRWFLKCSRPAMTAQQHPILGLVPICAECLAWYQR